MKTVIIYNVFYFFEGIYFLNAFYQKYIANVTLK